MQRAEKFLAPSYVGVNINRHPRWTVGADGRVFWQYDPRRPDGKKWVSWESAVKMASSRRRYDNEYYRTNPRCRLRKMVYSRRIYAAQLESCKKRQRIWYERNKAKVLENMKKSRTKTNKRLRDRYRADELYAIRARYRSRTYAAFKNSGYGKHTSTSKLLGCCWNNLKKHIEGGFVHGMSWHNRDQWHIDHIIPLSSATTIKELEQLCHYTNLQPLWAEDNLRKHAKMPDQSPNQTK